MKEAMTALLVTVVSITLLIASSRSLYQNHWEKALYLGKGKPSWAKSPPKVLLNYDGPIPREGFTCQYGFYWFEVEVKRDGSYFPRETIFLWVEDMKQRDEQLLHEFLHAVWNRRRLRSASFWRRNPDTEAWVKEMLGD